MDFGSYSFYVKPKDYFSELVGMRDIKNKLKASFILPYHQPQLFSKRNKVNSVLFYGPPGTGKTKTAESVAKCLNARLFCFNAGKVFSKFVGETEKEVSKIFSSIEENFGACVLFIDEVDSVFRQRSEKESDHARSVKSEFLKHLSAFSKNERAILVAATNRPWDIDSAFMRRFQSLIYFPLPSTQERMEFLQHAISEEQIEDRDSNLREELGRLTEGFTMADLEGIVRNAINRPLVELQECTLWVCHGGFYIPYDLMLGSVPSSNYPCKMCSIYELPPHSVKCRAPNLQDMIDSTLEVRKTVTLDEMQAFEAFQMQVI